MSPFKGVGVFSENQGFAPLAMPFFLSVYVIGSPRVAGEVHYWPPHDKAALGKAYPNSQPLLEGTLPCFLSPPSTKMD